MIPLKFVSNDAFIQHPNDDGLKRTSYPSYRENALIRHWQARLLFVYYIYRSTYHPLHGFSVIFIADALLGSCCLNANLHDRQPQTAPIRGCLERTTDPSELVRPRSRQIEPDFEIVRVHRYGVARNKLAIEVEEQVHFGQLADGHTFDADRLAALIGSNPDCRRGLAPAKLDALIFF